jgi:hypothetical protein
MVIERSAYISVASTLDLTLNAKYELHQREVIPKDNHPVLYFGIGIGGLNNVFHPFQPTGHEYDLYHPMPIRCVPIDNDLLPNEMLKYRIRVKREFDGKAYLCYYLKVLERYHGGSRAVITYAELTEAKQHNEFICTNVNEIGLYSGEDKLILDVRSHKRNGAFQRMESFGTQLRYKFCNTGLDITENYPTYTRVFFTEDVSELDDQPTGC